MILKLNCVFLNVHRNNFSPSLYALYLNASLVPASSGFCNDFTGRKFLKWFRNSDNFTKWISTGLILISLTLVFFAVHSMRPSRSERGFLKKEFWSQRNGSKSIDLFGRRGVQIEKARDIFCNWQSFPCYVRNLPSARLEIDFRYIRSCRSLCSSQKDPVTFSKRFCLSGTTFLRTEGVSITTVTLQRIELQQQIVNVFYCIHVRCQFNINWILQRCK